VQASADQVIARILGTDAVAARVVVSGHIDSRMGTPGALDNATGVIVLLLVAEMLAAEGGAAHTVEFAPFNGEDDYAARGQVEYLALNEGTLGDVVVNVNIDGAGWSGHEVEVSLYGCPDEVAAKAREALAPYSSVVEGEPWPQGDHMIFAMRGIPAIALTTSEAQALRWEIAHTERDVPALVDVEQVVQAARYVRDFVRAL
jgi:aminopeptidase YwaD